MDKDKEDLDSEEEGASWTRVIHSVKGRPEEEVREDSGGEVDLEEEVERDP